MLVTASAPIEAGLTHSWGTKSSPPPMGTGAVGTSTARQGLPATSTGSALESSASAEAPPGPPKWHHTGVIERTPCCSGCCSSPTMRWAMSHTVPTSGMRRSTPSRMRATPRCRPRSTATPSSRMAAATTATPMSQPTSSEPVTPRPMAASTEPTLLSGPSHLTSSDSAHQNTATVAASGSAASKPVTKSFRT